MRSKTAIISLIIIAIALVLIAVFWLKQKKEEREVIVSQEVIKEKKTKQYGSKTKGLVSEDLEEHGRNFKLKLVAEVKSSPQSVYKLLTDFENLKELIPDCTQIKVLETKGNKKIVYMKRFILFMGKEMGGRLEYTLHPEDLKFEMKVMRDPNANLHEYWTIRPVGDRAQVIYIADVQPKLKVPNFMAQAWIKDNFVDLMKAVKTKLEKQSTSG